MLHMGLNVPQYIGCKNYILDRLLKYVPDFYLNMLPTGPNLNYKFIDEIIERYEVFKISFVSEIEMPVVDNLGWSDDFRFLYIFTVHLESIRRMTNYRK